MLTQFQQGNNEDNWNVLVWCSVPIPFDDCATLVCEYTDGLKSGPSRINFWYFLFWYFGIYNGIALFLIVKLFSIYALNWYPKVLGAKVTFCLFWLISQGIGAAFYLSNLFQKSSIIWVLLTFFTMAMPLWVAFILIHRKRMDRRHHGTVGHFVGDEMDQDQKKPFSRLLFPTNLPRMRAPASYRRFLWFCAALAVALFALVGGEMYAYIFLSTQPHTAWDSFFYIYSWVGAIYIMDAITDYILYRKIRSHPLASVTLTYEEYKEKIGRSFYLRNLAENTTMLGFLFWVNILHFGPNRAAYPYFHMDDRDGNPYNHNLTFLAAIVIWTSELASSYITRTTFKKAFNHSITQQAIREFKRYPEMIIGYVFGY
ncbi:hypothetical protein K501DRAFT_187584 [Backusella circina FSU 941]|nr:hypothetical protein K501DRAFT_187584 [Backusella circina FSU 941]